LQPIDEKNSIDYENLPREE